MTGKTHYRLGIMYYLVFSILPFMASMPIIKGNSKISLAAIGAAALGALIVDSDTERSMINQSNPVTFGVTKITSSLERILNRLLRFIIGFSSGYLILHNIPWIIQKFGAMDQVYFISYLIAFTCIFAGIASERFINRIPVIAIIYNTCSTTINVILSVLKRFIVLIIYATFGIALVIYNLQNGNHVMLYIFAIVILGTAVLPHRTFLHSIEGFILYSIIAVYISGIFEAPQLGTAFIVGYFSHIYLADVLTNTGVPVSVIPTILRKIGVHKRLMKFSFYRIICKVLDARLCISVMSTGTASGNVFEYIYCSLLFILTAILVISQQGILAFSLV
ncbi:metal-dependent hydrolase [Ruminiclostridium papyrosolvens]|uniref:Uncharacterized protein n=1 Tax=Ruminiclostridium papyrosolvens C7 TaxID=1330534 RepID=U4R2V1_9FIRM|nr:metal-dependent hydrolase [Ruminiclostridium papyrosolvens]EPR12037.1 hypothetical protein L323_09785 [Ruminiclostridium papyrosolvens C7]